MTEEYLHELLGPNMLGFFISLAIGLILGLEREYDKLTGEMGFAGIRTFPIISILGYMIGILSNSFSNWLVIVSLGALFVFLGFGYLLKAHQETALGITTNLALITTFVLGLMVSLELYRDSVAAAVVVVTLLSLKATLRNIIQNITSQELFAFIKFVFIALLILPFLPNEHYGPNELLNPFEIGSVVVIVSFLNFFGYFLVKFVGSRKGILLTAILGGLISSTAVAWNYAAKSKETPHLSREYSAGIVIASAIMFPRIALLAAVFNTQVAMQMATPLIILTLASLVPAFFLIRKKNNSNESETETEIELGNPLNVLNALGFALIYVTILYAVHYGNAYLGQSGLYYSSIIAGLADTTAISISMAKFGLDEQYLKLSALVILAAALSNTVVKLGIAYMKGSKETGRYVGMIFGASIVIGVLYILIAG